MRNGMIKAGVCVPSLKVSDIAYNTKQILKIMEDHRDCGLLVFPELCVCGYTCADLFQNETLLDACERAVKEIAGHTKRQTVVIGAPVRYGNSLYNGALYCSDGKLCAIVPKSFIPTYSEFYESRWFASGRNIHNAMIRYAGFDVPFGIDVMPVSQDESVKLGTDICEDVWVPEKPGTRACLAGANVVVNLSASDEVIGKEDYRRNLVKQQSADCYCAYLYASAGMGESSTDLVFSGHALIAENGALLKESIFEDNNQVITSLLDLDAIQFNRIHQNTFHTEEEQEYRHVSVIVPHVLDKDDIKAEELSSCMKEEGRIPARMPFVPKDDALLTKRAFRILRIQANGLATRVRATHISNLIIGISGGLDSTLALIVCHEAQKLVPEIRIIAYTMPNEGNTTSLTYDNAMNLMKCMNCEIHEVPIRKGVEDHLKAIGHALDYQGEGDVTYENAQARMRTYILMDAANLNNGLVVGTGDLSELALGWCTYNGDHMSMYGVNCSIPKTLVQYIVKAYAKAGEDPLKSTLLSIVDTPISPELTPNNNGVIAQKTEDKIGKYDLNDFFLYWNLRWGASPARILAYAMTAYPDLSKEEIKEAEKRFFNRFFHQQFKRSCLPDGPKVGSVTLSPRGDWRMPSDASVSLWLDELDQA